MEALVFSPEESGSLQNVYPYGVPSRDPPQRPVHVYFFLKYAIAHQIPFLLLKGSSSHWVLVLGEVSGLDSWLHCLRPLRIPELVCDMKLTSTAVALVPMPNPTIVVQSLHVAVYFPHKKVLVTEQKVGYQTLILARPGHQAGAERSPLRVATPKEDEDVGMCV